MLVRDLTGWIARRAAKETEDASRRCRMGSPDADREGYRVWLESYANRSTELIATRLEPVVKAWSELDGVDLDPLANEAADCGKRICVNVRSLAGSGYVDGLFGPSWADMTADGVMMVFEQGSQTNGKT